MYSRRSVGYKKGHTNNKPNTPGKNDDIEGNGTHGTEPLAYPRARRKRNKNKIDTASIYY